VTVAPLLFAAEVGAEIRAPNLYRQIIKREEIKEKKEK
jgi:hypothetical protein